MWQRWNQTTHIFEKSDNNGGSWTPLGLSADIITEGALAKARQHAQVAYKDEANTFTLNQLISKSRPELQLLHSGNQKGRVAALTAHQMGILQNLMYDGTNWNLDDTAKSGWVLRLIGTDEGDGLNLSRASAGANPRTPASFFAVDNTGTIILSQTTGKIRERNRSTPLGDFIAIAYNSGNYTASGGVTWTVTSDDQLILKYTLIGTTVIVSYAIATSSTSAATNELRISTGITAAGSGLIWTGNNVTNSVAGAVTWEPGFNLVLSGESFIRIYRPGVANFPSGTGDLQVRGTVIFEAA